MAACSPRPEGVGFALTLIADGFFRSAWPWCCSSFRSTSCLTSQLLGGRRTGCCRWPAAATYTYSKMAFADGALRRGLLFIVIAYLLRFLGRRSPCALVVAHNWGCVIVELFNLPAGAVLAGLVYAMAADLIFIALCPLYHRFYIAQTALRWGGAAMDIAVLEFLFTIFLAMARSRSPALGSGMSDGRGPIAIFDSGVGGLIVAAAIARVLPNESFVYLGDTARRFYGTKYSRDHQ